MRPRALSTRTTLVVLIVVALAARFARGGGVPGLFANQGYDDGTYFAASVAFVHSLVPYRDFLIIHPPGIVLALAPFAALTYGVSDPTAFAIARLAYMALGAVNTVLVFRVARPWGRTAAVTAGALYALLPVATGVEATTMLEPWGTLALLMSVLLARRAERPGSRRWWSVAVGAAVAIAPVTKIWGVITVAIIVAWHAYRCGARLALRAIAGAALTTTVVIGPFLPVAGRELFRAVIRDQLTRPRTHVTVPARITVLTGISLETLPTAIVALAAVVIIAGLALSGVVAWRARRGRLWVVLATVQVGALAAVPSSNSYYGAWAAPAMVLVVASALAGSTAWAREAIEASEPGARTRIPSRLKPLKRVALIRGSSAAVAVAVCAAIAAGVDASQSATMKRFPAEAVRDAIPTAGCVRTDSAGVLVLIDRLSSQIRAGCLTQIDLSGLAYDLPDVVGGVREPMGRNVYYQRAVAEYLSGGSAVVLARGGGDGFSDATLAAIRAHRTEIHIPPSIRVFVPTDGASGGSRSP